MKAYGVELRERVVNFINSGGTKMEAAKRFQVARRTVYNYLSMSQRGSLQPKKSWGRWRKLNPQKLRTHVKKHPDATLKDLQRALGVSHNAIWIRLRQLGITLKKTHKISRTQRSATV